MLPKNKAMRNNSILLSLAAIFYQREVKEPIKFKASLGEERSIALKVFPSVKLKHLFKSSSNRKSTFVHKMFLLINNLLQTLRLVYLL